MWVGDDKRDFDSKPKLVMKKGKGRGRRGRFSRKAAALISGCFRLWKICDCLKAEREKG